MRTPRIILDDGACAYHCISRVVGQERLFTDAIKEKIQEIIINAAHLHGIHLINWTILSNHTLCAAPHNIFIYLCRFRAKSLGSH